MIRGVGDIAVDAASIHAARSPPPRLYSLSGEMWFLRLAEQIGADFVTASAAPHSLRAGK
jgi:hypothetical protein